MPPIFATKEFLNRRVLETEKIIRETREFADTYPLERFLVKPEPESWSAAQVIEHLNSYNRYYLPAIQKALQKKPAAGPREKYRAGWLGTYFANLMMPGADGRVKKKMPSPRDHRPLPALSAERVLDEFWKGEEILLSLIEASAETNIGAIRIPVSISPLIRLKLGDTLHFLIAHQLRHLEQIKRIFPAIRSQMKTDPLARS